jgi:hypothetical protein
MLRKGCPLARSKSSMLRSVEFLSLTQAAWHFIGRTAYPPSAGRSPTSKDHLHLRQITEGWNPYLTVAPLQALGFRFHGYDSSD